MDTQSHTQSHTQMDTQTHGADKTTMKTVFAITERAGKSYWTKIGIGFLNKDGSITLKLEAIPVNGQIQVREYEDPRERRWNGAGELRGRAPRDQAPRDEPLDAMV